MEDPDDTGNAFLNSLKSIFTMKTLILFIISIFLERFFSLVNIMQIMVLVSMFRLGMTADLATLFGIQTKIATFELFGMGDYFDELFEYKKSEPRNGRMALMEFDR